MTEVESKILDINKEEVIKKLEELGARKILDSKIETYFFDKKEELLKEKKILRLRNEGDKIILCFKEKLSQNKFKSAKEIEIEVSSLEDTRQILKHLRYDEKKSLTKHRISYKLDSIHFDIDWFDDIPPFLEIEATTEALVLEGARKLGFEESQLNSFDLKEVLDHYGVELK